MSSKITKTRNAFAAITILIAFTFFLGSCGQESSEYATASTSSDNSSTSDEGTTVSTLSAPSGLGATAGSSQAVLSWGAVSGASSYILFWKTSSGVSSSDTSIASISTNSYTHTSLSNGTTYYYKVAAVNSSGTGTLSSEVSTTPAADSGGGSTSTLSAPANMTATATTGTVSLNWDAVSGATSYTLYWATSSGITSSSSAITSISTDNYTHASLSNGSTYYYKVAAIDDAGTGTLSSEVNASPVLSVPTNLTATSGNGQNVLDWDNVTGATSYTVYWDNATGVSSSSTTVTSISSDNYTHSSLTNGTAYYYKVAAVDASSTGTLSSEVSATPVNLLVGGSIQSGPLTLSTKVTTFAGSGSTGSTDNSTGTLASFDYPSGITTDGTNLYITDSDNNKIRQIVISSGEVTTIAGTGSICYSNTECDGTGTSALTYTPMGITTDGINLYWSEINNHTIRQMVLSSGAVTTLAGSTNSPGSSNGTTGSAATFKNPNGLTTDGTNLYVADFGNHMIRKIIISSGEVTTVAGSIIFGGDDLTGTNASFFQPKGITMDGTNLYVAELYRVRKIVISTGAVTTLAGPTGGGKGYPGSFTDSAGNSVKFSELAGITSDGTNLYLAARSSFSIYKVVIATGAVTTIAGDDCSGCNTYLDHDTGTSARFKYPISITTDGSSLYVGESYFGIDNNRIRKIE